jgi:hypothetical protein
MTGAQRFFQVHATAWFAVNAMLFVIWLLTSNFGFPWFVFPAMGWGVLLATHATFAYTKSPRDDELDRGDARREIGD